jgi:hypothetical protein
MWRALVVSVVVLSASSSWALARPDYALGLGFEARQQRDVNPDSNGARGLGQLYGMLRLKPWAIEVETSHDTDQTHSGSLNVKSQSTLVGAWGRFEYLHPADYTLFAALGYGMFFDQVDTQFQTSSDHHTGTRDFMGAGTGLSTLFWEHLQLEVEGRILNIQETKDPVFSALVRVGCQI